MKEILELLFTSIGTVLYSLPSSALRKARAAIGDTDSDDVPYLATAITIDRAVIWSDDAVFDEQQYVPWHTTQRIIELYDDGVLDSKSRSQNSWYTDDLCYMELFYCQLWEFSIVTESRISPETLTTGVIPWRRAASAGKPSCRAVCRVPGFAALSSHPQGVYSGGD
jgi:hypothetical protein